MPCLVWKRLALQMRATSYDSHVDKDDAGQRASAQSRRKMQQKRSVFGGGANAQKPLRGAEGPARLVNTKGYSTTMAVSTMNKVLAQQSLRRGDAAVSIPATRTHERLLTAGRLTHGSTGVKHERTEGRIRPV